MNYWRGGEIRQAEARVGDAPPDQDSAQEWKDEAIGLTLKQATYEVRAALNMKPTDPGLVVTEVESGSPAGLARLRPNEIVQSADNRPLDSPTTLSQLLAEARASGKEQIRLVVVTRGQRRFADLKL